MLEDETTPGEFRRLWIRVYWTHRTGAIFRGLDGRITYRSLCGKLVRRRNHGRFTEDPEEVTCRTCRSLQEGRSWH